MIFILVKDMILEIFPDSKVQQCNFINFPQATGFIRVKDNLIQTNGQPYIRGSIVDSDLIMGSFSVATIDLPSIYVHLTITPVEHTTQNDAGIYGIQNEGIGAMQFTGSLRLGSDPESTVIPVTKSWLMTVRKGDASLRNSEQFGVGDYFPITLKNGIIVQDINATDPDYIFRTKIAPGKYFIQDSDFDHIIMNEQVYQIKLINEIIQFEVFENIV